MIRSRLRRPTSKSTMTVLWPRRARPVPMAALVVFLPTPHLPEVTTRILANMIHPKERRKRESMGLCEASGCLVYVPEKWRQYPLKASDVQHVTCQVYLDCI